MTLFNRLCLFILGIFIISCGSDSAEETSDFSLELTSNKTEYQLGEKIQAHVTSSEGNKIESIVYFLGDQKLSETQNGDLDYTFENEKLGKWDLTARITSEGKMTEVSQQITLFNDTPPATYTYEIINTYPHKTDAYTQGLEFYRDTLYESTGHYGRSTLKKVDLETGEAYKKIEISSDYFAEGITILNNKIYQLTWKEDVGFIYDVDTFEKLGEFGYNASKEGWGLANDGERIYKSDGSEKIWFLSPETLAEEDYIQTVTHRTVATQLNELEWVEGKLYANTYQKNGVAIINPENGAIEGLINFEGLKEKIGNAASLDPLNDVLNGIAYDAKTKRLFVTGKDWDTLFEVKIIPN